MPEKKPTKRTWRDLMDPESPEPDDLMTRDGFLALLQEQGVDVSYSTLVYWETQGVIPRPIRRWVNGAPNSLYPGFMVPIVRTVRALQASGKSLSDIRDIVSTVPWLVSLDAPEGLPATREDVHALSDAYLALSHKLRPMILELASLAQRMNGVRIIATELEFIDAHGGRSRHGFGMPSHQNHHTDS